MSIESFAHPELITMGRGWTMLNDLNQSGPTFGVESSVMNSTQWEKDATLSGILGTFGTKRGKQSGWEAAYIPQKTWLSLKKIFPKHVPL